LINSKQVKSIGKGYVESIQIFIMASYTAQVAKSHKKFNSALKRAKTRQGCLKAYYSHKKEHEALLKRHLKEEMSEVNKKKAKIPYR
jgi:hypothetical protein